MQSASLAVLNQTVIMFIILIIGAVCYKVKLITDEGTCACGEEAEAYLWVNGPQQYGYFDDMLALAEKAEGSCVYLRRDVTIIRDTPVTEGNFSIAGGSFKVTCSGSSALVFSGGTVSIRDGMFGRLKVTGKGKLTLNGGNYYAIDVTGSTYKNYGQLLPGGYAFKTSTGWEAKGNIATASFESATAKEVKILPLRSVTISADGETTVPYGTSVKFTATLPMPLVTVNSFVVSSAISTSSQNHL